MLIAIAIAEKIFKLPRITLNSIWSQKSDFRTSETTFKKSLQNKFVLLVSLLQWRWQWASIGHFVFLFVINQSGTYSSGRKNWTFPMDSAREKCADRFHPMPFKTDVTMFPELQWNIFVSVLILRKQDLSIEGGEVEWVSVRCNN